MNPNPEWLVNHVSWLKDGQEHHLVLRDPVRCGGLLRIVNRESLGAERVTLFLAGRPEMPGFTPDDPVHEARAPGEGLVLDVCEVKP